MAELLRTIDRDEAMHFAPMRELIMSSCHEVYEIAGEEIYFGLGALEDHFTASCYLVRLSTGLEVVFPFEIAGRVNSDEY